MLPNVHHVRGANRTGPRDDFGPAACPVLNAFSMPLPFIPVTLTKVLADAICFSNPLTTQATALAQIVNYPGQFHYVFPPAWRCKPQNRGPVEDRM